MRVKRELESGMVSVGADADARAADDSIGHQSASLRDAQGHHGREEKEIREVKAADLGLTADDLKPAQIIERAYLPEKSSGPR